MFDLTGRSILIVESGVAPFVQALQRAIAETGAQSLVIRHPATVAELIKFSKVSAAVINVEHQALVGDLDVPTLVYGQGATPKSPEAIVWALFRILGKE